jgi:hypothetical protein
MTHDKIPSAIQAKMKFMKRVSVKSKLSNTAKDGYYLSSFFIDEIGIEYLDEVLANWDTLDQSDFNARLKICIGSSITELEFETKKCLTNRGKVVSTIFDLYKSQQFIGLIPLVLSQVDGIMKEITGGSVGFYNSNPEQKRKNPNRLKYLEHDLYIQFFSNYEILNVENRNEYELFRKDISDLTKFNRHAILHGESHEFGNETNAIKSILLITFMAELYAANPKI